MGRAVLKALVYLMGTIGGISLVMGVILRLTKGAGGAIMFNIIPVSYVEFAEVCFLFAIALGIAAVLEEKKK
ncbi:hypothetical protein LCGC14_0904830 [marine sediment metagenome]|uniref:Uncharacterized protein n=1 Tax=marine sediment metagenome TaxID=412755 RepID=A0A0F9S275_9ZZZZ